MNAEKESEQQSSHIQAFAAYFVHEIQIFYLQAETANSRQDEQKQTCTGAWPQKRKYSRY